MCVCTVLVVERGSFAGEYACVRVLFSTCSWVCVCTLCALGFFICLVCANLVYAMHYI